MDPSNLTQRFPGQTNESTEAWGRPAQSRHKLIREHIEDSWQPLEHFLTGSYDRHTKTKKLKDVEIFAVIDPDGPQGTLPMGPVRLLSRPSVICSSLGGRT